MLLCLEIDLLYIFNIVKNMTYDLIKGMFKMIMQSLDILLQGLQN